jgi:signal transduction histidine kinase/ABC-type cobalamin/Fe3+-siderophores transport system ATPase subunit
MPPNPNAVRKAGLEVLWQDHGVCDDLDVGANVVLGREGRALFARGDTSAEVTSVLRRVGAGALRLDRRARTLSRGQKQLVALGRALLPCPKLLVLDEPTASLGVNETLRVQQLIHEVRDAGSGVLLVTHDLEQVFTLADRIVVLRQGRAVADVSPMEVQRADVVALMSGMEMDSMAQRQLQRLRSLVDQLSDVEPAASLPLIVSAMAAALDQEMLCVHLLDASGDEPVLQRTAAVGLPTPLLAVNERLPIGADGGCAGVAAARADVVVFGELAAQSVPPEYRRAAARSGIQSEWAAPIVGARGVLGTVTGYGQTVGQPDPERLELARLYMGYAASTIERERLLAEVSRRNRILEALRGVLETIAGPDRVVGGLSASLGALSRGLGAVAVGALVERQGALTFEATDGSRNGHGASPSMAARLRAAARGILDEAAERPAHLVAEDLAGVMLRIPEGRAALVAHLTDTAPSSDTLELLDDASRSLALAIEAEMLEVARREAVALRRSRAIQRELLSSLSHELRTPLTAIHGYASTLCQPDLTWDPASTERFLHSIAAESARMERLVGDLLDSTAIESGSLRLHPDWCDVPLVVEAALRCVAHDGEIRTCIDDDLEPVWADHDRLEQVLVNLLENAVTHGRSDAGAELAVRHGADGDTVEIHVRDYGGGVPRALAAQVFEPHVHGATTVRGAGLGLSIAKGIVEAHGGSIAMPAVHPGTAFLVSLPKEPPEGTIPPATRAWSVVAENEESDVV